jgi:predicted RecB family nuclease
MEVYDFEFEFRLDVIAVAQQHRDDPSVDLLVVPVRTGECADCPWWGHCHQLLTQAEDVSLLPYAGWNMWAAHRERGVRTLADLAALDPATDAYADTKVRDLPGSIDMARARVAEQPVFLARGVDRIEVRRGDLEIDLDLECDDDGGVYLWGALVSDPGDTGLAPAGYRSFVTWDQDLARGEVDVFRQLCTWLSGVLDDAELAGRSVTLYCFNEKAEAGALRRLATLADAEPQASGSDERSRVNRWQAFVERLVDSPGWVDLLPICRASLVTGRSMGLKYVAPLAGFRWEDDDAGGEQSMTWYHDAVHDPDPDVRAANRERVLTYNRNDVEATLALRDWLERTGPSLPRISDLDRQYRR